MSQFGKAATSTLTQCQKIDQEMTRANSSGVCEHRQKIDDKIEMIA